MKKIINKLVIAIFLLLTIPTIGQVTEDKQKLQKEVTVDAYVGGPNLSLLVLKIASKGGARFRNWEFGGIPRVGARIGIACGEKITLGVEINYKNTIISYEHLNKDSLIWYDHEYKIIGYQAYLRAEYHWKQENEKIDIYFPVLLGVHYAEVKYKTNSSQGDFTFPTGSFSAFSPRAGVGLRYFPKKNIGVNTEIGLGGGVLFQLGMSIRV